MVIAQMIKPEEICEKLTLWAEAAGIRSRIDVVEWGLTGHEGAVVVAKSDLLLRMIYAGEMPSVTKCPVHKGVWSGIHMGWPETFAAAYGMEDAAVIIEDGPMLQGWYDEGCRCFQHRGSQATTGWQPDEACGCIDPMREANEAREKAEIEAMVSQKMMQDEEAKVLIGAGSGVVRVSMDEKGLEAEREKRRKGG